MADKVTVKIDGLDEVRLLLSGIKNGTPKAMTLAGNRAIESTVTKASKIITTVVNLRSKVVKAGFNTKRFNYSNPNGYFLTKNKAVPGIDKDDGKFNFGFRKLKKGYSMKVLKASGTTKLKTAFKIKSKKGTNIAVRSGKGKWAFKQFWSLSPADILADPRGNKLLTEHAADVFQKRMAHETVRLLIENG